MQNMNPDSELIIGLIATVGTEVDRVIGFIRDYLRRFSYNLEIITVSSDILSQFNTAAPPTREFDRISHYMDLGDKVREKTSDNAILMKGVAGLLSGKRMKAGNPEPRPCTAYIIKSIKHPEEIEFLRDVYDNGFHLIGLTSSYERRKAFLTEQKFLKDEEAELLLDRDAQEEFGHGQHTQDAFQQADYFINVGNEQDEIRHSVFRLIDLIFGNPFISPSFEEHAMFMAYVSSLRSADLSRQIGVVIAKNNEIIATGANDCPKAFGGLYWPIKKENGQYVDAEMGRDYMCGYDSNKKEQRKIIKSILELLNLPENDDNICKIERSGISDLTEYGRVVHGEMEALMMCARNNISCRDAELYATTYPCHNCAKHIIAAGIKKVVYIEPYPKSKAKEFYRVEITENPIETDKVLFTPFVGVGPHKFIDLFAVKSIRWYTRRRKDKEGNKLEWRPEQATLRNPMPLLTYIESECAAYTVFQEEVAALKEEKL